MPSSYRIVVKDRLSRNFAAGVDPMMKQSDDRGRTVLTGRLIDQSQLLGIINHLHDLGVLIAGLEVTGDE